MHLFSICLFHSLLCGYRHVYFLFFVGARCPIDDVFDFGSTRRHVLLLFFPSYYFEVDLVTGAADG